MDAYVYHSDDSDVIMKGNWIPASQEDGITKEIISVKSFNISEVAMVETLLTVMSTQSEEIIEIDKTVNVTKIEHAKVPDVPDKLKYEPFFCASVCYGCCGWFQTKCECCAKTYPNGKNSKGRYGFPESKCLIDCVNLKYTQITTSQGDGQLKLVTEGAACCSGCIWCCGVCKDVGPQKRCDNCCAALSPDCDPETKFASELRGAGSCDKCSLECCCCATACCCCMECCFVEDRASGKEGAKAWTEKVYDHSEETIKTDDPFDIVCTIIVLFVCLERALARIPTLRRPMEVEYQNYIAL